MPLFVMGLVAGLSTARLERLQVGAVGPEWDFTFGQRLVIAGRALWFYLGKAAWPANLSFIYPRWEPGSLSGVGWLFPALFALLALALLVLRRRLGRGPAAALGGFAIALAPALGFVNVYPMRFSFVADHFQYLAIVFPLALVAGWGVRAGARWPGIRLVGLAVLLLLGVLTARQAANYGDEETLWRATLERNPGSWLAYASLGILVQKDGRTGEAEEYLLAAERLYPDHFAAFRLGLLYDKSGRGAEAERYYREAVRRKADYVESRAALAELLFREGRYAGAVAAYGELIALVPGDWRHHYNLALALAKEGRDPAAVESYRAAISLKPDEPEVWYSLGNAQARLGDRPGAIGSYRQALGLRPGYALARRNLDLLLAPSP
jgi:tetratricopeptide (TPR) repeat protein